MNPNVDALLWNGRAQESAGTEKIYGVVPAMVVAIDDKKEKRHRMGAVQVRFPWLMDPIARDILPWARCTTFASGQDKDGSACGWISTPQIGDEVLVGFEDGDVHRPYILGGLFNPTGGDGEKGDDDKDDDNEEKDDDKKDDDDDKKDDDDKPTPPPPFVNVHFQLGYSKDEITDEAELQLKVEDDEMSKKEVLGDLAALGKRLKEHGEYHYEIQGHADRSGDAGLNMDLSRRRAQSVLNYLVKNGAGGSQLHLSWYGESAPTVKGAPDGVTNDADRRAECHLLSPKKCTCGKYTCPTKAGRPKPGGQVSKPIPPAQQPGQGGQQPGQGGQQPGQGGQQPGQGGQQPGQGGQQPGQGGQQPGQGGQQPGQGGQQPGQGGQKPDQGGQDPAQGGQKPDQKNDDKKDDKKDDEPSALRKKIIEIAMQEKARGVRDGDDRIKDYFMKMYDIKTRADYNKWFSAENQKAQLASWCNGLATYCWKAAGTSCGNEGTGNGCTRLYAWLKSKGKSRGASFSPKVGDMIFWGTSGALTHVGLIKSVSGGNVTTIEGNYSNGIGYGTLHGNPQPLYGFGVAE